MLSSILRKFVGSRNERLIKNMNKIVAAINALETKINKLSTEQLANKTTEFRERINQGATLDDLLVEAFAVVREVAKRTLNMRHFDVQLIGGIVLHNGQVAEMSTGEGKTLVATLPAYLNALSGKGVHIVTVNDYLAKRDAEWMRPVYEALQLTVGIIVPNMDKADKRAAYAADITYGTNNEFGFDYLRDNMSFSLEDCMQQRGQSFAIVDEVDSILIDEARTPLIISGADEDSSKLYKQINTIIPKLTKQEDKDAPGDFSIDEKSKQVFLSESGHHHVEELLSNLGLLPVGESLYDASNINLMHHVNAGLRAHKLFSLDVDYIIQNGEVVIVDEHTGRTMPGRRWSDGLHQAVEAKEGVAIQKENQTLASITFQNYFRLYQKLSGMTGTADTEAYELQQIYGLEVVIIPTNKPNARKDHPDLIYMTKQEKFAAIVSDIKDCVARSQPVLIGTISIETSEYLSKILDKHKIKHQVLNAKFHQQEAKIVAEAGSLNAVTIATNMAGRGTDIVLGGNINARLSEINDEDEKIKVQQQWQQQHQKVINAGGLHIIGTERHESRRIDNQLRGRSGRQGDPGSTQFYLSLEDNLMRIFISERISMMLNKLGLNENEAITHPWVSKAIENAQRKVEGHNFDIRKQLLEFDDVANEQRKVIYAQRKEIMEEKEISELITKLQLEILENIFNNYIPPESIEEQWDLTGLEQILINDFNLPLSLKSLLDSDKNLHAEGLQEIIKLEFNKMYTAKANSIGLELLQHLEKSIMLNVLDNLWKEHLATMDYLRKSIHLRGYAQKDPKQEYKREAFNLFKEMLETIKYEAISVLTRVQVQTEKDIEAMDASMRKKQSLEYHHDKLQLDSGEEFSENNKLPEENKAQTVKRDQPKIGRNEVCPCGSGKKYKQCHGKL